MGALCFEMCLTGTFPDKIQQQKLLCNHECTVEDEVQNYLQSAFVAWSRVSQARFCSKIKTAYQAIICILYWTLLSRSFLIRAVVRFSNPGGKGKQYWIGIICPLDGIHRGWSPPWPPIIYSSVDEPTQAFRSVRTVQRSQMPRMPVFFSFLFLPRCLYLVKSVPKFGQY